MKIYFHRRSFDVPVREVSFFGRWRGLMFRKCSTENLLFSFPHDVHVSLHSYFVFFQFLVLWLDAKNNIVEARIVSPFSWRVCPAQTFRKIVEVPYNEKAHSLFENFRRERERFK